MINKRSPSQNPQNHEYINEQTIRNHHQTKQKHKSQLHKVYQQLRTNYDREAKVKNEDNIKFIFQFHRTSSINRRQDNVLSLPKFSTDKYIINESIYINSKRITQRNDESEFEKLILPKTNFAMANSTISQRNKRLLSLCKRAEDKIENQKIKKQDQDQIQIKNKKRIKKIESILRESKFQINFYQKDFSKLNLIRSKLFSSVNTYPENSSPILTPINKQDPEKANSLTKQLKQPKQSKLSKQPTKPIQSIIKPFRSASHSNNTWYNWKQANFPTKLFQRNQVLKLFRRYKGVGQINVPSIGCYKFFIGEGNNGCLVGKCLKNRGYWSEVNSLDDNPNFVWSQHSIKRYKYIQTQRKIPQNQQNLIISQPILPQKDSKIKKHFMKVEQIQQFLKLKNNSYFETINRVYDFQIKQKILSDVVRKFKSGYKVTDYFQLWQSITKYYNTIQFENFKSSQIRLHNHIENSEILGNKKDLLRSLCRYGEIFNEDVNDYIPSTIHIESSEIGYVEDIVQDKIKNGPWIVKPGEGTNRGNGITVHTNMKTLVDEIKKKKIHRSGQEQTYIIQQYITPMLYNYRKFDIRMWVIWTGTHLWMYNQGYLRTSSKQFNLNSLNKYVHLTNDAVQSTSEDYGKYEPANKLSFNQLQKYLLSLYPNKTNLFSQICKKIKQIAVKAFRVGGLQMDNSKLSFQLFGLDYLLDSSAKPWLIQVNSNPCLEINCSLLSRLIPNMIDSLVTLCIDPYFMPPDKKAHKQQIWNSDLFRFQLIYDKLRDYEIAKYKKC